MKMLTKFLPVSCNSGTRLAVLLCIIEETDVYLGTRQVAERILWWGETESTWYVGH
jgi:hypothetical protein